MYEDPGSLCDGLGVGVAVGVPAPPGAEPAVAGHCRCPAIGLPGPRVTGANWRMKQAATTTPLASDEKDTSFCWPKLPQFRFMNDCCRRIAMNVNRLSAAPVSGLGAFSSRLTSC